MDHKESVIQSVNSSRLAIFARASLSVMPIRHAGYAGSLGKIEQRDIGKAFAAEIANKAAETGAVFYDNQGGLKTIADITDRPTTFDANAL
ncbi:hypothetical protein [Rhodoferax sp.]|uniref:hypothetical protein n=1 Tax=Rhodoferax sp. TaxID=50421 RepID=UPI00374CED77